MGLAERIRDRSAVIGIIGLGYVGVPLVLRYIECGFRVTGFDVNAERIRDFEQGLSPIGHVPDSAIAQALEQGFVPTTDYARIADVDAIIICVPTPLDKYRQPNLTFVEDTLNSLAPYLRADQILSLESTTWPGTTEEIIAPVIRDRGLTPGEDFYLVYSPEREDPGNADFDAQTIPKIIGGMTEACRVTGEALYGVAIDHVVPVSSTRAAEMVKLLENIHRAVNIGLVNEMKIVAHAMGLDIFEIIRAAATKPFGFTPYYPGPGIGGHCIPVDPFYLTWKAREFGVDTRFIELAGEVNADMPGYVVDKLIRALNEHQKALKGARILVLGIAYKADVDDPRESPAIEVMERLRDWGADICYADPHIPRFPAMRDHHFDLSSITLTPEVLSACDAVLLLTAHTDFDYEMIGTHARILIDTRGRFIEDADHIYRA